MNNRKTDADSQRCGSEVCMHNHCNYANLLRSPKA
jgi:hypothetical protein